MIICKILIINWIIIKKSSFRHFVGNFVNGGFPKWNIWNQSEINIWLAQLILRCKFFGLYFYVLVAKRAHDIEKYSDRPKVYTLGIPRRESTSMEKLSRGLTSKKTEFRQKFYRCKYSFWFRPSPARITRSTPSIRNNWPSVDPSPRDDTSQITEFQTCPSNFHIFLPRDAVEILCARCPRTILQKDTEICARVTSKVAN